MRTQARRGLVVAATAAALAAWPAAQATAATAEAHDSPVCSDPAACAKDVTYTAAPGEHNVIEVEQDGPVVVIRDSGAHIVAGPGCEQTTPAAVRCRVASEDPLQGTGLVNIDAGDLGDTVTVFSGPVFRIAGGEGDDTLIGSDARGGEYFVGGPGSDLLDGGGGREDVAGYGERTQPITADLRRGSGGELGEDDLYVDIEGVDGGSGDDDITGSRAANLLSGNGGDDVIFGGVGRDDLDGGRGNDRLDGGSNNDHLRGDAGNDVLDGGSHGDTVLGGRGADRLTGGRHRDNVSGQSGRDILHVRDGRGERVNCGTGRDRAEADRIDVLTACERIRRR